MYKHGLLGIKIAACLVLCKSHYIWLVISSYYHARTFPCFVPVHGVVVKKLYEPRVLTDGRKPSSE
jgi:hypothetical protein